jgi:hypothetical protein
MVQDAEMMSNTNQDARGTHHVPFANNNQTYNSPRMRAANQSSSIPARLQLSPSPQFNPNLHPPALPNLSLGGTPGGSPIPKASDIGQDSTAFASSSPYLRATKSAVDTAVSVERERIMKLEEEEASYTTIEEFKVALRRERLYSKHLVTELAALKSVAVASTLEAEVIEEGRINCLMRRLDGLQKEKGRIIVELEREEEMVSFPYFLLSSLYSESYTQYCCDKFLFLILLFIFNTQLTNTLQKKLNQVRREKESLEQQIEREHLVNARLRAAASSTADMPDAIVEEIDN